MRNFKRAIFMTLAFLVNVFLLTALVIEPYYRSENYYYEDSKVRRELSGSIDTIICGASHGFRAFVPEILDSRLGCNSYNLSCAMMTMQGRYTLLKKEIERNPVKTVVLELSFNALTRDRIDEGPEGDIYTLGRFDNGFERVSYFFTSIRPKEYFNLYYDTLNRGVQSWKKILRGSNSPLIQYKTKGYIGLESHDMKMTTEEIVSSFHQLKVNTNIYNENELYLNKIFNLCNEKNIRIIIVTTPLAEKALCKYEGMDIPYEWYKELASEWDCELFDFNLLKDKCDRYPDETAFYDTLHLSDNGAITFSNEFVDLLQRVDNGQSISSLFFSSYEEAERYKYTSYIN